MADTNKTVETISDYVPPPYGEILKVTFAFLDFVGYFGNPDPVGDAIRLLQQDIQRIQQELNGINERVNVLAQRVIQLENNNRLQRLNGFAADIDRLQFQIGQQSADANVRALIARDAGAIAETFLNELDLWNWTDIQTTWEYDDNNALINTTIEPMAPDFKAYPALPVYLSAVMTWLTAIDLDTSGNYQLVQQRYGDKLRRHIGRVTTRPGWNELTQPPTTFPEEIQVRISCYPDALDQFAMHNECHFTILCKNVMDRQTTVVDNSDFVVPFPTGTLCTSDPARGLIDERQIEADRGVDALTQLGELLSRVEQTGTLRKQFIGSFDFTPSYNTCFIYAAKPDGELLWWRQRPSIQPNALTGWDGPRTVGSGWDGFVNVYAAGGNRIYALKIDGTLVWYQHNGFNDGTFQWEPPKVVGSGWNQFATIFAGGDGVMYAVQQDGILRWYKNSGFKDGSPNWSQYTNVGTGWNSFKTVFSCGKGIIYAVENDGTLLWYRHKGFENGAAIWDGGLPVGSGWQNFSHIVSVGDGVIFAIQANGNVLWYRHEAWNVDASILNGEGPFFVGPDSQDNVRDLDGYMRRWSGPIPSGNGWTGLRYVFPLLPSAPDPVN